MPSDPGGVLGFLQDVNQCQNTVTTDAMQPGPIVVHCAAGVGRAGTIIVIDILLHLINYQGKSECVWVWFSVLVVNCCGYVIHGIGGFLLWWNCDTAILQQPYKSNDCLTNTLEYFIFPELLQTSQLSGQT